MNRKEIMPEFQVDSILVASIAMFIVAFITLYVNIRMKGIAKESFKIQNSRFFREDYKVEIERIFSGMYYYCSGDADPRPIENNAYYNFKSFVRDHPEPFRHLLQHIYTSAEDGKTLFEKIKKSVYLFEVQGGSDDTERDKLYKEFINEYYKLKEFNTKVSHPNFGACEECIKHTKLVDVQKHKKFFEEKDSKFWDLYSQNFESV